MKSASMITTKELFEQTLYGLVADGKKLAMMVLGTPLSIDAVCIFAQSEDEYRYIQDLVVASGTLSVLSHGSTTYVDTDMQLNDTHIVLLGVRRPDPTRMQRGYVDYPVRNLAVWATRLKNDSRAKIMKSGLGRALVELTDDTIDCRGYLVEKINFSNKQRATA